MYFYFKDDENLNKAFDLIRQCVDQMNRIFGEELMVNDRVRYEKEDEDRCIFMRGDELADFLAGFFYAALLKHAIISEQYVFRREIKDSEDIVFVVYKPVIDNETNITAKSDSDDELNH